MKDKLQELYNKSGTRKVLASLISILIGLVVGAIVVIAVGLSKDTITNQGMWDGHPVHRTERGGQPDLGLQCPGSGQYAIPGNAADHDRPFRGRGL